MSDDVILVNNTRRPKRMLVLNIPPNLRPERVTRIQVQADKQGRKRARRTSATIGSSVRVPANGESAPIPKSALRAPDIASALLSGAVLVKEVPKPRPEASKGATKTRARRRNS